MKRPWIVLALVCLAACGVDGEPKRPDPTPQAETGVRVSGYARFGISVSRMETLLSGSGYGELDY